MAQYIKQVIAVIMFIQLPNALAVVAIAVQAELYLQQDVFAIVCSIVLVIAVMECINQQGHAQAVEAMNVLKAQSLLQDVIAKAALELLVIVALVIIQQLHAQVAHQIVQ